VAAQDPSQTRVLVVEDDPAIREGLELNLQLEGYQTVTVSDGEQALAAFAQPPGVDLVLLDVMLPGRNGFEVLRTIRQSDRAVPVILLTARVEEADKVLGLELGADDYVTKPFGLGELRARVRAALRRSSLRPPPPAPAEPDKRAGFGDVELDRDAHRVRRSGMEVPMTAREFALLGHFLDQPGRVLSRQSLLAHVWGLEHATLRTVDNFVMRLRSKFEPDPDHPRYFVTVRGVGYRFSPEGEVELGDGSHQA